MWAYIVLFFYVIFQQSAMKAYIFYLDNFSSVSRFAEKAVVAREVGLPLRYPCLLKLRILCLQLVGGTI